MIGSKWSKFREHFEIKPNLRGILKTDTTAGGFQKWTCTARIKASRACCLLFFLGCFMDVLDDLISWCLYLLFLAILTQPVEWIRIHKAIDLVGIASTRLKHKNLVWLIFIHHKECCPFRDQLGIYKLPIYFCKDSLNEYQKENLQYSMHLFSCVSWAIIFWNSAILWTY